MTIPFLVLTLKIRLVLALFLRYQTKNIIGGNSKSKILFLTHDLSTFFDLQKIADEMMQVFGKSDRIAKNNFFELVGRNISICASKRKTYNEYRRLLNMIFSICNSQNRRLGVDDWQCYEACIGSIFYFYLWDRNL